MLHFRLESKKDIERRFGTETLTDTTVQSIFDDPANIEILDEIRELLTLLEFTAVGVNTGVLDKDIWFRMSGSYIIRLYYTFRVYITQARRRRSNSFAYIEFEEISKEFEERRRVKPDPRGKIID